MTDADKLAQVLAEHQIRGGNYMRDGKWMIRCKCGEWLTEAGFYPAQDVALATHQAAVVLAHLTAEGWAQGQAVVHVHHHDIEARAAHFNEGYETAMAQHLGDDPGLAEDWLHSKFAGVWDAGYAAAILDMGQQDEPPTINPWHAEGGRP